MPSIIKVKGDATEDGDDGRKTAAEKIVEVIKESTLSNGGKNSPTPHEMDDVQRAARCAGLLGEEKDPPTKKSNDTVDIKKCQDENTDAVAVEVAIKIDEKSGDDTADEEPPTPTEKNKTTDNAIDENSEADHDVDDAKLKLKGKDEKTAAAQQEGDKEKNALINRWLEGRACVSGGKRKRNGDGCHDYLNSAATAEQLPWHYHDYRLSDMNNHPPPELLAYASTVASAAQLQRQFTAMQVRAHTMLETNPMLMQLMAMQNPQMMAIVQQQQMMAVQQERAGQMFQEQLKRLYHVNVMGQSINTFDRMKQNRNNIAAENYAASNNTAVRSMRTEQSERNNMLRMNQSLGHNTVDIEAEIFAANINNISMRKRAKTTVDIEAEVFAANINNISKRKRATFTLMLPPGKQTKLGMVLKDNKLVKMAELKWLAEDSPFHNILPKEYHMDCCIARIECHRIGGKVIPHSAKHCQDLLVQCYDEKEETAFKLVLVKLRKEEMLNLNENKKIAALKKQLAQNEQEEDQALQTKQPAAAVVPENQQQQRLEPVKVLLTIPSDESIKLGMILQDNHVYSLPELVDLSIDSPIQKQIATEYQRGCCVVSLKSHKIGGQVSIKSAEHFQELIIKCRTKRRRHLTVEMVMMQIPVEHSITLSLKDVGVAQSPRLQSKQASHEREKEREGPHETAEGKESLSTSPSSESPAQGMDVEKKNDSAENEKSKKHTSPPAELPDQVEIAKKIDDSAENETSPTKIDENETSDNPSTKPSPNENKASNGTPKKKNIYELFKEWNKNFDKLVQFKRSIGHFNVNPSLYPELARWVFEQRVNESKLTKNRLQKLQSINFPFDEKVIDGGRKINDDTDATNLLNAPYPTPSWDERYESLSRFKGRCGLFPASGDLHDWLEGQKEAAEHLSSQHIKKLHELGVKLDLTRERLDELGIQVDEEEENSAIGQGSHDEFRKQLNELFWKSAQAAKMFGFSREDDILKGLQERIDRLKKANESVDGWKTLVPNDDKEELYTPEDVLKLRHKVQILTRAYSIAMKRMNEFTWDKCCKQSAEDLCELVSEMSSTLVIICPTTTVYLNQHIMCCYVQIRVSLNAKLSPSSDGISRSEKMDCFNIQRGL